MCGPGSVREMAIYIVGRVPLGRWPCTLLWLVVWLQEWLHITSTVVALDSGPAPLCLHSGDAMCCCGTWCPGGKELLGRGGSTPEAECQWWVDWLDNERGSAERLQERTWLCSSYPNTQGFSPSEGTAQWWGFSTRGGARRGLTRRRAAQSCRGYSLHAVLAGGPRARRGQGGSGGRSSGRSWRVCVWPSAPLRLYPVAGAVLGDYQ